MNEATSFPTTNRFYPKLTYQKKFSLKQYALVGMLIMDHRPDVGNELLSAYTPKREPLERDFAKLPDYFNLFCQLKELKPKDFTGPLYKTSKVEIRRQFIGAILHIYMPQLYDQPADNIMMGNSGFTKSLSGVLKIEISSVSKTIRDVIIFEKRYEDFAEDVVSIVQRITGERNL